MIKPTVEQVLKDTPKLQEETRRRVEKIQSMSSPQAFTAEWKTLMTDEAARNHFVRLMCVVAIKADDGGKSHNNPIGQAAYEGSKMIIEFVVKSSVMFDYMEGKLPFSPKE